MRKYLLVEFYTPDYDRISERAVDTRIPLG